MRWAQERLGFAATVRELAGGTTSTMLLLTAADGPWAPPAVLRLMTREPWRRHGPALTARESAVQALLADTPVPAPRSLALDATGEHTGHPAHLMTAVGGVLDLDRVDDASLAGLAACLAVVHDVPPPEDLRRYQSWAGEPKHVVPPWAADPGPWQEAFALLRTPAPAYDAVLVHRDFSPRNVLWSRGRVAGVVDWVETSRGPAWLDVAHAATELAMRHGTGAADRFAAAYGARTGREPQPYFDVMDVVGQLPLPGAAMRVTDPDARRRLEERLRVVLDRVG